MYFLASFLALLAVVGAQQPQPCESPREWNGRVFQVDRSKNVSVFGKVSYDELGERVRFIEEVDITGKKTFYDNIILYREEKLYSIKLSINRTGECTVYDYHEPFRPVRVPAEAKFAIEAYIGGSVGFGTGVLVNTFYGEEKTAEETVYYVTTVTQEGCIPVHSTAYGKNFGTVHSSFFDVMLGTDPEHFIPPTDCKPGKQLPLNRIRF